jgi:UDP-3-O-[3-hydroxymyristoyl] glucosamine N-acyltransferase
MSKEPETPRPSYTLAELARILGCPFEGDGRTEIRGVSDLDRAEPGDLVFLADPKHRRLFGATRAAAVILPPDEDSGGRPALRSDNPRLTFLRATELFFSPYRPGPGIDPAAVVSPTARIGGGVSVGALSVIGEDVEIGEGTVIFPLVSIYPRVRVGAQAVIHSQVTLREGVRLGNRVILHPGVVVGADGFAYVQEADGSHHKIPQTGTVVIEDDVEVGANTTIDRAAFGETIVRRGTKIDNLVMVAHNVQVGPDAILIAQVGIAGSSKVGRGALLAGQVGISDHVTVGDGVVIAAKSGVTKDIPAGSFVAGIPHLELNEWRKLWVAAPRLYGLLKDFKKLQARLAEMERKLGEKPSGK